MITDQIKSYIGVSSETEFACDAVERGAVRRFAQAIMDEDPVYDAQCALNERFGGPIAQPLFTNHILRRPFGTPDPIQERANDPDFDGLVLAKGLPTIEPLAKLAVLNGGSEFEFFRHARHGERVSIMQRYADITSKQSSKGLMYFVEIESEFRTEIGELLMRARRTQIRR
jgi:acyl dehydratase